VARSPSGGATFFSSLPNSPASWEEERGDRDEESEEKGKDIGKAKEPEITPTHTHTRQV